MSEFVPFPPPPPEESQEGLFMVGFRVDPNSENPQIYTLLAMNGENDRPLLAGDRILFFANPELAAKALGESDNGLAELGEAPLEPSFMCDVATALSVVNSEDSDEDGIVMDVISCFDDLIRATKINVPAQYMSVLSALAERLGEEPEFGGWLAQQGVDRETVEDAIMWCVGAVAVKSTFVTE